MKKITLALSVIALSFSFSAFAAGDVARGEEKSAVCMACHNVDGNSTQSEWPKIAGQHQAYMVEQLVHFRAGSEGMRPNPVMEGIVAGMSDADFEDLSAFFAGQAMSTAEADTALVELGREIYLGGNLETGVTACAACHGPGGLGNAAAKYPRVAGQMEEYMFNQLKAFESGERKTKTGIMGMIAKRMSEDEMRAVSSYMSGLRQE